MSKDKKILDIPKIQKMIHNKHDEFVKEYGMEIDKVAADYWLFTGIITAKLNRILFVFKDEKVIDKIDISEEGVFKKLCLSKAGYNAFVNIITNGTVIILENCQNTDVLEGMSFDRQIQRYNNVNDADFDWVKFSEQLLEYIHVVIYKRKKVFATKLDNILNAPEKTK